ncbi:hypothetical protein PR048_025130 [Dryococelus australis]|uniref:DUF4371 domain-containing protein n=1 Tax=Dryococelus australis TaxID=614101 RepID=A0ABQ9GQF8_9NEOP|nr:hypothetical protein PR048_025130 [Dryococelus australis]
MLQLLANELVRSHSCSKSSHVLCHIIGTRDVSGKEQICICLRYVDEKLSQVELFVGLCDADSTTGEAISNIIFYVFWIRLQLLVSHLRGQACDGASNMSGHKRGVQALVKEQQPLAPFIHCGVHTANLMLQVSCGAIKNSLQLAIGVIFSQSLNARHELKTIMELDSAAPVDNIVSIQSLCPMRWVYRRSQIDRILEIKHIVAEPP